MLFQKSIHYNVENSLVSLMYTWSEIPLQNYASVSFYLPCTVGTIPNMKDGLLFINYNLEEMNYNVFVILYVRDLLKPLLSLLLRA